MKYIRISGVIVTSSVVDCVFKHRSGQTKDFKIGICCFSAMHDCLTESENMNPDMTPNRMLLEVSVSPIYFLINRRYNKYLTLIRLLINNCIEFQRRLNEAHKDNKHIHGGRRKPSNGMS